MYKCRLCWLFNRFGRQNPIKDVRGYLLLEVLVALPILIFLAASLFGIFWLGFHVYQQQENKGEIQYYSRAVLQTISADIKQGQVLGVDKGNKLEILDRHNMVLVYSLGQGQIYRTEYRLENQSRIHVNMVPVCEDIETLEFRLLSPGLVAIHITGKHQEARFSLKLACRSGQV